MTLPCDQQPMIQYIKERVEKIDGKVDLLVTYHNKEQGRKAERRKWIKRAFKISLGVMGMLGLDKIFK